MLFSVAVAQPCLVQLAHSLHDAMPMYASLVHINISIVIYGNQWRSLMPVSCKLFNSGAVSTIFFAINMSPAYPHQKSFRTMETFRGRHDTNMENSKRDGCKIPCKIWLLEYYYWFWWQLLNEYKKIYIAIYAMVSEHTVSFTAWTVAIDPTQRCNSRATIILPSIFSIWACSVCSLKRPLGW